MLSFEFSPAKTEKGQNKLRDTAKDLQTLNPAFYSVTFGAGGGSQDKTVETVLDLQNIVGIPLTPHITCIRSSREELKELLLNYKRHGITRLVALRGDIPKQSDQIGELPYAADLVSFIREISGSHFHVEVAAYPEVHPEARCAKRDLDNLKAKQDAGADSAITQYFYNLDGYYHFLECCQAHEITIPIVPGVMPIHNVKQLERFSDICGAELPRWIRKTLEDYGSDQDSLISFGIDFVTKLCEELIDAGVPGLHFYTLNRADISSRICSQLNLQAFQH